MAGHCHHPPAGSRLVWIIGINALIAITQTVTALWSGSLSLLSDAVHNFGDMLSLVISYTAEKLSRRSRTPQETFGHQRAEIIAAFINSALLVVVAVLICQKAVERIGSPVAINAPMVMAFAALGILGNGACVLMIKDKAHDKLNLRSAYLHLFSDMLTSVAVLLGGAGMYFFGFHWLDSILSIAISIYLICLTWGLLLQTIRVLMHFTPSHIDLKAIETAMLEHPTVANIHHVHIWQLNDHDVHFEAHIDFKKDILLSEACQIIHSLQALLKSRFHIQHIILQPEVGIADSKDLIVESCHDRHD